MILTLATAGPFQAINALKAPVFDLESSCRKVQIDKMLYLRGKSVRWRLVTKLVVFGVAITTISILYFQAKTLHVRLHLLLQPSYYVPILVAALRF